MLLKNWHMSFLNMDSLGPSVNPMVLRCSKLPWEMCYELTDTASGYTLLLGPGSPQKDMDVCSQLCQGNQTGGGTGDFPAWRELSVAGRAVRWSWAKERQALPS